jgi:DNA repair exonuclease SbcCD ATPase subunit
LKKWKKIDKSFEVVEKRIDDFSKLKIELSTKINENQLKADNSKMELTSKLESSSAVLTSMIESNKIDYTTKIESSRKDLITRLDGNRMELSSKLDSSRLELSAKVETTRAELSSRVENNRVEFSAKLDRKEKDLSSKMENGFKDLWSVVDGNKKEIILKLDANKLELSSQMENNSELVDENRRLLDQVAKKLSEVQQRSESNKVELSAKNELNRANSEENKRKVEQLLKKISENQQKENGLVKSVLDIMKRLDFAEQSSLGWHEQMQSLTRSVQTASRNSTVIDGLVNRVTTLETMASSVVEPEPTPVVTKESIHLMIQDFCDPKLNQLAKKADDVTSECTRLKDLQSEIDKAHDQNQREFAKITARLDEDEEEFSKFKQYKSELEILLVGYQNSQRDISELFKGFQLESSDAALRYDMKLKQVEQKTKIELDDVLQTVGQYTKTIQYLSNRVIELEKEVEKNKESKMLDERLLRIENHMRLNRLSVDGALAPAFDSADSVSRSIEQIPK